MYCALNQMRTEPLFSYVGEDINGGVVRFIVSIKIVVMHDMSEVFGQHSTQGIQSAQRNSHWAQKSPLIPIRLISLSS